MNTRQTAAFQHRNPDVDAENCFYDHANCLHEGPNVSHLRRRGRRLNYITIFCAICLAVWLMATIAEHIR